MKEKRFIEPIPFVNERSEDLIMPKSGKELRRARRAKERKRLKHSSNG